MNTQSIPTRRRLAGESLELPGDFSFADDFSYIYIILPGMKSADAIAIQRGDQGERRVWGWDGNEDQPTLTPSIHLQGHWHGFLNKGQLESC